jgi:hypothetical protein
MNPVPVPELPFESILDPRGLPDFVPSLFPLANGIAPAASADPRNDQVVLAFLAAYYELNVRWIELRELRSRPHQPGFAEAERTALQTIEAALRQRDELEDRFAPYGIIAEPVLRDGIALDIQFTFGSVNAMGRFRAQPVVSSGELTFNIPSRQRRIGLKPPGPLPATASRLFPCAD